MNRQELIHWISATRMRHDVYGKDINLDVLQKRLFAAAKKFPALITVLEALIDMREAGTPDYHILVALEMTLREGEVK